jgi:hypothetical protein
VKKKSKISGYTGAVMIAALCAVFLFETGSVSQEKSSGADSKNITEQSDQKIRFSEVWGYLMQGEEAKFTGSENVTDIMYFGARINDEGRLIFPQSPPDMGLRDGKKYRYHLVVYSISGGAMLNAAIDKKLPFRNSFIKDMIAAAKNYDGLHIDFETVTAKNRDDYHDMLRELKKGIGPDKRFTVLVMPRRRAVKDDPHDYKIISSIADRVFVMAYDQHWSTSAPGPVASIKWCKEIIDYTLASVPRDKLIMGIPMYGRAWQDNNHTRSLHFPHTLGLLEKHGITPEYTDELGAYFEYTETVTVKVFYENARSIIAKANLYNSYGILGVGFWRIGQEDKTIWQTIDLRLDNGR